MTRTMAPSRAQPGALVGPIDDGAVRGRGAGRRVGRRQRRPRRGLRARAARLPDVPAQPSLRAGEAGSHRRPRLIGHRPVARGARPTASAVTAGFHTELSLARRRHSRRAEHRGVSRGHAVVRASSTRRARRGPSSARTVAIFRPGCTAGVTAPMPSGPMCSAAASRSSTLMTRPQNQAGAVGQTAALDDLDDEAATAEAVEALADLADLAYPPQRRAGGRLDRRGTSAPGRSW